MCVGMYAILISEGSEALPRRMALSQRTPAERVPQVSVFAHFSWVLVE